MRRVERITKVCLFCGKSFESLACIHRKYCSKDCFRKSWIIQAKQFRTVYSKGHMPWCKGKRGLSTNTGRTHFKKGNQIGAVTLTKWRNSGAKVWNKGIKTGLAPWLGKKREDMSGSRNFNWQGGKSFEPYGLEFNEDLKEVIRNRDRRKCFICEKTELENKEKLTVHHIDYNK